MKVKGSWQSAILIALLALGWGAAFADPKGESNPKVNPALIALHAEHAAHAAEQNRFPFAPRNRLLRVVDEQVVIDAVAEGDVAALRAALSSLGMRNMAAFGRVISGQLAISAIPALAGIASLRFARPATSLRHVGAVTSQGDQAMRADVARITSGVTGAGVTVGVLSDSFNCKGGAPADVASDDLSTVNVVEEGLICADDIDEGRAMLQIVHDVAPGASLAFATADGGEAHFANNILALKANGAAVIVDDIGYLAEPMFQDGIIAQAVDTVVRQGAAYFSAAGNEARQSYQSAFRAGATPFAADQFPHAPGAPRFRGGIAHNFAPSGAPDYFQRITIPAFSTLIISLQWDSPFFSVSGAPGSPNDVDVYLFDAAETTVVDGATDDNVPRDPVELFSFTNSGPTADFNLMIVSFAGPPPGFLKYVQFGDSDITIKEFDTASGTLVGHVNADGAEAVGAAFYGDTPAFGVNPPVVETFSSSGGTPIFFDTAGNRFASPVIRRKPGIVAPDGGNTTFFVSDSPRDPDSFPNFFGTSAAAPHAAGVAALLREKQPVLAPVTIYAALQSTAIDMGPAGFDFDTGFGLVQADAAVALVSTLQSQAAAILPSSRSVMVGTAATAFATVINAGPDTAVGVGLSLATPVLGTFSYQTTNPLTNEPTGAPNTPTDIPAHGAQTYVISITPSTAFTATDVQFSFAGANTFPVPPLTGISTLLLTASNSAVPDVIALAATATAGLTVLIPGNSGAAAFAVATANVGAAGSIKVTVDKGNLPIVVGLCQTVSGGMCIGGGTPLASVTTTIGASATPTFSFFIQGQGFVPFDPAINRIFVRFTDVATGTTVGSTSVAVRTQ